MQQIDNEQYKLFNFVVVSIIQVIFLLQNIKMASPAVENNKTKETTEVQKDETSYINMESVNRVVKLPVVEAAINTATNLYGKAKVILVFKLKIFFLRNPSIYFDNCKFLTSKI